MKFIFTILLSTILLLSSNKIQSQTSEEIQSHLLQYFQSISNKDYDTLYDILAPSFKKYLPKDDMFNLFDTVDNDERLINQIVSFDIEKASEPVIYDDIIYLKLDYLAERHAIYTSKATEEFIQKANITFEKNHNNFEYIVSERKVITIDSHSVILCINDKMEFHFIPYLPKLYPYMHLLMPQEAIDELFK